MRCTSAGLLFVGANSEGKMVVWGQGKPYVPGLNRGAVYDLDYKEHV